MIVQVWKHVSIIMLSCEGFRLWHHGTKAIINTYAKACFYGTNAVVVFAKIY